MKDDAVLRFAELEPEGTLLFAVEGSTATEVTFRGIEFSEDVPPLFEDTKVTKLLPVMVEGTYALLDPTSKQYRHVTLTAGDIAAYLANTPRDVVINYEHRRNGTPKGWVRLKDTGVLGTLRTSQGEKAALFANLELYSQSAADVRAGYFRDVSVELKPVSKEIIGCALTSTPVMRDLQFYSNLLDVDPEVDVGVVVVEEPEAPSNIDTPATDLEVQEPQTPNSPPDDKETPMTEQEKQALFAEMLQNYGLTPEELADVPSMVDAARAAKAQARLTTARESVRKMADRGDGQTVLAPAGVEAAAHLLVFAQENAELQFSIEGESKNPEQLLEELFSHLTAVQLFGESSGVSADAIDPVIPVDVAAGEELDTDRVSGIVERMRQGLRTSATPVA
jgi:hypothetical protein